MPKFKAWDKEAKRWIYHKHWMITFDGRIGYYSSLRQDFKDMSDRVVLVQFIGKKDENGVDICQGDIVKTPDGNTTVVWWKTGFYFKFIENKGRGDWVDIFRPVEVIGNIYENPELIKEK